MNASGAGGFVSPAIRAASVLQWHRQLSITISASLQDEEDLPLSGSSRRRASKLSIMPFSHDCQELRSAVGSNMRGNAQQNE
jgi:hypothetical protein